jgi:hypothetical protein
MVPHRRPALARRRRLLLLRRPDRRHVPLEGRERLHAAGGRGGRRRAGDRAVRVLRRRAAGPGGPRRHGRRRAGSRRDARRREPVPAHRARAARLRAARVRARLAGARAHRHVQAAQGRRCSSRASIPPRRATRSTTATTRAAPISASTRASTSSSCAAPCASNLFNHGDSQ